MLHLLTSRTQPPPAEIPAALSFLELAIGEASRVGQEFLMDVPHAVEWVFGFSNPDDPELENCDSATLEWLARQYRPAEAELLERTKGQPFRLETPEGPFFLAMTLWRFWEPHDAPAEAA